ncbi:MAG: PHP domain-containing protein [Bacillota bacterium]|nr:PHP domain-containing protein [Bacillota bacterium]
MITYDLHVHSCLSADADDDMTPVKVIDRAIANGLDIVAITDHNSIENLQAANDYLKYELGGGITFIPGIEVESAEEVHLVCLFPDIFSAIRMGTIVGKNLHDMRNKPKKLGHQYVCDEFGEVVYEDDKLLRFPTKMTIEEILFAARQMKGVAFYAHLESKAYSVLSVLGSLPVFPQAKALEFTNSDKGRAFAQKQREKYDKFYLFSSDAHSLDGINTKENSEDLEEYADAFRDDEGNISADRFIGWLRSFEGV